MITVGLQVTEVWMGSNLTERSADVNWSSISLLCFSCCLCIRLNYETVNEVSCCTCCCCRGSAAYITPLYVSNLLTGGVCLLHLLLPTEAEMCESAARLHAQTDFYWQQNKGKGLSEDSEDLDVSFFFFLSCSNQGRGVSHLRLTLPVGEDIHTCSDTETPVHRQKQSFNGKMKWEAAESQTVNIQNIL